MIIFDVQLEHSKRSQLRNNQMKVYRAGIKLEPLLTGVSQENCTKKIEDNDARYYKKTTEIYSINVY